MSGRYGLSEQVKEHTVPFGLGMAHQDYHLNDYKQNNGRDWGDTYPRLTHSTEAKRASEPSTTEIIVRIQITRCLLP